jgi:hypothetical protein
MTTTRTSFTVAVALTLLSVVGCKKEDTATPDDATAADAEDEAEAEDEPAADASADEDEVVMLSKGSFDEAINDHMQEISDCYVAALERDETLAGKLDAEFTFDAAGVPTGVVAVEGSTLSDAGLVQCIADAAKGWSFGKPKEAGLKMRYTFNLAPAG